MQYHENKHSPKSIYSSHSNIRSDYLSFCLSYLSEVEINEAEGEELQAHREAVEQPIDGRGQVVGLQGIAEVKGEQSGTKGSPK